MAEYFQYLKTPERGTTQKYRERFTRAEILNVINKNDGNMFKARHELESMAREDYIKDNRYTTLIPALGLSLFSGYNVARLPQLTAAGKLLALSGFAFCTYYTFSTLNFMYGSDAQETVVSKTNNTYLT